MKIAFLDHPYHRRTRSSLFFAESLKAIGSVEFFHPGADWRLVVEEVACGGFDVAVCWQHEFYAPALLAAGVRVLAVPMYDGSGSMSDAYWRELSPIPLINFSSRLHDRVSGLGLDSLLVRYFPPIPDQSCRSFDQLRAFVWARNQLVGWRLLKTMTGDQLHGIHLHVAADDAAPALRLSPKETAELKGAFPEVSLSTWFEKKADFRAAMLGCNVFLAPRLAEGIGLPVLEAMSHGMCVLAHALPTMDEYIAHGHNGLLSDFLHPEKISLAASAELGRNARDTIARGRQGWENDRDAANRLVAKIAARPAPSPGRTERARLASFPERYWRGIAR